MAIKWQFLGSALPNYLAGGDSDAGDSDSAWADGCSGPVHHFSMRYRGNHLTEDIRDMPWERAG